MVDPPTTLEEAKETFPDVDEETLRKALRDMAQAKRDAQ